MNEGWHQDPYGDGERYFADRRWTGVTRATPAQARSIQRGLRRRTRWRRRRSAMVLVLAGCICAGVLGLSVVRLLPEERLLPAVTETGEAASYAFLKTQPDGDPVGYSPCEPVEFFVNPDRAPADFLTYVLPGLQLLQEASGIVLEYAGETDRTWAKANRKPARGEVVIDFVDVLASKTVPEETVGLGGSAVAIKMGVPQPHYRGGTIALKTSWFHAQSQGGGNELAQAVLMHEIGHVLGLGHVDDGTQMMSATATGQVTLGLGDRAGLARLGAIECR